MTRHLSPEELVTAGDGQLEPRRRAHLERCAACQAEVAEMRKLIDGLDATRAVPEPSPLFWDHFSQRVREATADLAAQPQGVIWRNLWRPVAGIVAATAALVLVLVLRSPAPSGLAPAAPRDATRAASVAGGPAAAVDENAWSGVAQVASRLSTDDVRLMVASTETPASIDELTPEEQQVFVNLVQGELDRAQ